MNLVTALLVRRGSEFDLNLRSAYLHLMGDVASTIGAVIAGVVIYFTKADWLDPLVERVDRLAYHLQCLGHCARNG